MRHKVMRKARPNLAFPASSLRLGDTVYQHVPFKATTHVRIHQGNALIYNAIRAMPIPSTITEYAWL